MAFSSPIRRIASSDAERVNPVPIAEAKTIKAQSPEIQRSNRQGWHSDTDLMSRTEPGLAEHARFIEKAINSATKSIAPNFPLEEYRLVSEGWTNINSKHAYNKPHSHGGFMWSGCWHVTVPEVSNGPSPHTIMSATIRALAVDGVTPASLICS